MRRLIGLLPLLHALPLLAYLLLRGFVVTPGPAIVPERRWLQLYNLVSLLNEFTPWFFLPLPLWLITLAASRQKVGLFATAVPWVMFGSLYGELFVPGTDQIAEWMRRPAPGETRLRVMTFNILGTSRSAAGLVRVVQEADPDVLMTQELIPTLAQQLDTVLGDVYPYSRLRTNGLWEAQGIWSRYPIVSEVRWEGSRRGANWQHAVVDVNGQQVHVVNLHLSTPRVNVRTSEILPVPVVVGESSAARSLEVDWLVPRLRALSGGTDAVVVAGDLNLTDQTPEFGRLLAAGYADAHRQAGWGFGLTFPAVPRVRIVRRSFLVRWPLIGIDHILLSPHVRARRAEVWPEGGSSDHRPVVADLVLRPTDPA